MARAGQKMTHYKYIIIGILLMGATVLFNGLLHINWPDQEDRGSNIVQNDTRDSSTDLETEDANADSQLPSLRDRILGNGKRTSPVTILPRYQPLKTGSPPFNYHPETSN